MSSHAVAREALDRLPPAGVELRVAFVGGEEWVEGCAPTVAPPGMEPAAFAARGIAEREAALESAVRFNPHVTVFFEPWGWPLPGAGRLGTTLGVVAGAGAADADGQMPALDRLVSFDPGMTGERLGGQTVWRAVAPPVSDASFAGVRLGRVAPRAMSLGRSSPHREAMLMAAKHRFDLLQVVHGVCGEPLRELLGEHDVAVHVPVEQGGPVAGQPALHLAAGQLLLAEPLKPAFGLEPNIDYLQFSTPDELVWILERLERFPEMHQRIRVRGRLKAEQFRASGVFSRVVHDLLHDVAAFG